jgi:hypothetical protein
MPEPGSPASLGTPPAARPRARRAANAFIGLFLAYQLAAPLSYYVSGRVYDERFGWRMFSTVRLQQCSLRVEDVDRQSGVAREVALGRSLHVAWVNLVKRGWPRVIGKVLRERCAGGGIAEARLERRCRETDGTELPPERFALDCDGGTLRRRDGEDTTPSREAK